MSAGSQSAFQTIRNGVNSVGGAGINDATIKYAVDRIMKGGQAEFDKYKRNYEILQQKGTRTTVIPIDDGMGGTVNKYQSSFDINLLTKEQQKQYALAKAITEGETRIQKGIAAYAQAVSEGTSAAREEFKGNRYALQGAGGGGRSGVGGGNDKKFDISSIAFDNNKALLSAVKGTDEGPSEIWKAITQGAKESTNAVEQPTDAFEALNKAKGDANTGEIAKDGKVVKGSFNDAAGAVGSLGSALAGLDDPAAKIAGVIAQSIANVALAFSSAQLKDAETGNVWYWIAAVASGAAAMVSTIATIHSATGYARGGVIKAANGAAIPGTFTVPGTTYSNDQIPAMLNAGETVLTRAQAGNIASQLQGAGGSINLNGVLTGENIFLSADRYARRSGRGELVTFHR